jgi:hypothetical protein
MNTNEAHAPENPQPMAQPRIVVKAVPPHQTRPAPREVQDRARLATEVKGSLDMVRKTAENWRTGMAGLVTLVTATLLFKGRDSITDYASWVGYVLGALVLGSLVLAVVSLWLFLTAAYGRLRPTSAQAILDAGGVDVHNVHLATAALGDLSTARRLGLASAALLAAALLVSWYGPAPKAESDAYVKVVVHSETAPETETSLCGELKALDRDVTVLQVAGEPKVRQLMTRRLVSLNVVASC